MMTVSLDQIAQDLHGYIRRAAAGETFTIIDDGQPVAKLVGANGVDGRLATAEQSGRIRQPSRPKRPSHQIPSARLPGKPASQIVTEDRR
jgi:antitoxin (DNA-binding transcriptional repressor) of toxin-antitoxin stability system